MHDDEQAQRKGEGWPMRAITGDYRASRTMAPLANASEYVVEGMLPTTGASVWFGEGSVGKTQLLMWLAAHLASETSTGPAEWLGRPIRRRGQILVVSAEDLVEHLAARLDTILEGLLADHPGLDAAAVRDRIHLLSFLSLSDEEFRGSNPSLFRRRKPRGWRPSKTLRRIEAFVSDWNATHPADPIIGVIVDSAVSLSGFDLGNAEATTNFLFHLNRESRRQNVFWAIIGHVVKAGRTDAGDPEAGAVSRLRGSAMWSTTPRTVVEVRFPMAGEDADALKAIEPRPDRREMIYVTVVKANNRGADFSRRVLRRRDERYFDVTEAFQRAVRAQPTDEERILAVAAVIRRLAAARPDASIGRPELTEAVKTAGRSVPALAGLNLVGTARSPNARSLAGILAALKDRGEIGYTTSGPITLLIVEDEPGDAKPEPGPGKP